MALVFKFSNNAAREEREASGGGDPVLSAVEPRRFVGGRCETQSWTRIETCGLVIRFSVFLEDGLVVIIMVGELLCGEVGR
jgi:hypothetical protein